MTLVLLAIAILLIIYLLRTRNTQREELPSDGNTAGSNPNGQQTGDTIQEDLAGVTVHHHPIPDVAIDLRNNAERTFRVVGSNHWIDPDTMGRYSPDYFLLRREPENEYDSNAVAIYGQDRKFGYLEAAAAAEYAPLFDHIGAECIVARDQNYFGGDQFRLPHVSILRKMIDDGNLPSWHAES